MTYRGLCPTGCGTFGSHSGQVAAKEAEGAQRASAPDNSVSSYLRPLWQLEAVAGEIALPRPYI